MITKKFSNQASTDNIPSKTIRPEQWFPWKSFGKLLNDAILEMGWQERYSALRDIVIDYGKEKSGHLTINEFFKVLEDNPITEKQYRSVFYNLMDRNQDGIVSEIEFISGMLSLSPLATNDPSTNIGQLRLQFIFLYYDTDRNGLLNLNELKRMLLHISEIRSLVRNTSSITESKAREYAIHLIAHYDGIFGFNAFFSSVKNNILKGTGWLLRTHLDLVDFVNNDHINNNSLGNEFKNHDMNLSVSEICSEIKSDGITINCNSENLPQKCFKKICGIKNEHGLIRIVNGLQFRSNMKLCKRTIEYYMNVSQNVKLDYQANQDLLYVNNILNHLEIIELCDQVVEVIRNENSLIRINKENNAIRIFGGLYGQLSDLLSLFESFSWPHYQKGDILSMKYVFLGDYIDFGELSLEIICLLFSLKILYPDRIFLLRGNHEDVSINISSGFLDECNKKFGSNGQFLWERINDVFEFLSLAILINDSIMCLHSGIGKNIKKLEHLENISKPIHVSSDFLIRENFQNQLENKEETVRILDCLWSEIIDSNNSVYNFNENKECINETDVEYNDENSESIKYFKFDTKDVVNFISNNNIELIVRTSENCRNGCESHANDKIITVTSAANTRGINNSCVSSLVITYNNGNLLKFIQTLKFEKSENYYFEDNCQGTKEKFYKSFERVNYNPNSCFNYNKPSKISIRGGALLTSPNNSNNYFSSSPRSSSKIKNIDESPITPAKIKNLYGKPINLTAI
ncbi:calcineurin like phosphatase with 3x Efhand domains at N-terminus [Cryptosporidium ryanae]|uniref:calcineurin like phosphatase with 3x Efhand domains at N-terminus n=1 Tax=Cryptosporidium ryanae TaxID=515981 RepID=UPI00351A2963|nr:calcineurin like phosphatase with 3x Efhand domains at N-terminus [Cryptosporidium ryanae]